jgi:hypothetical protein
MEKTAMAEKRSTDKRNEIVRVLTHTVITPLVGSAVAVAYATGRLDLSALGTGLAITGTLALLWKLDRTWIYPRLKRIPQDWLRIETEMFLSVTEHVLGALLTLLACGHVFGFKVEPSTSWMLLIGIVLVSPILHGTEQAVGYYRQLREKERQEQDLRALAAQAELKALKAQINPHFLFNTLNTIAALIHTDPALAEASVERLAKMFRYALASTEQGQVPLEEELAFVDDYLEIERARFGKRLRVTREIDSRVLSIPVPSLILQPLVENAIQHGCGEDGGTDIAIRIGYASDNVTLAIADRGSGLPPGYKIGDDPGHGLRNVDERLRKLYGHGLELGTNTPHGATAIIKIPGREVTCAS